MNRVRPTGSLDKLARNTASIFFSLLSIVTNKSQQALHRRLVIFDVTNRRNRSSRLFAQAREGSRPADPRPIIYFIPVAEGNAGSQI